jgi:hypothetical protein
MVKAIVIVSILVILWAGVYFYSDVQGRGMATTVGTEQSTRWSGSGVNDKINQGGGIGGPRCNGPCCAPREAAQKAGCCP